MSDKFTYQIAEEFNRLKEIVTEIKPTRIMEIGSLTGETLKHWMDMATVSVLSIDMVVEKDDPRYEVQTTGHNTLWPKWAKDRGIKFQVIEGNSTDQANVQKAWDFFGGRNKVDFLFIDGGHDFCTCVLDYLNYSPLVRSGGVIAFHDRSNPDWPEVAPVWDGVKRHNIKTEEIGGRMGIGVIWVP